MLPKVGFRKKRPTSEPKRVARASYYQGRAQEPTSSPFQRPITKKSFSARLTKAVDWLIVVVIFFCVIYSLIVKPGPRVLSNSWAYHTSSVYDAFAAKISSAIKDRNKITFDESSLVLAMQKQFPEISGAWVQMPFFGQKPTVHITVATPAFLYSAGNVSYILNTEGIVVGTQASLPTIKGLPIIIDQSNIPVKNGSKVISSDSVDFINQIMAQAKKAKINISNIVLPAVAQEIQLRTTDKSYYVKFYFGNDVLTQTGQWLAARHEFDSKGITPTEYLDVRVPGKVFYK